MQHSQAAGVSAQASRFAAAPRRYSNRMYDIRWLLKDSRITTMVRSSLVPPFLVGSITVKYEPWVMAYWQDDGSSWLESVKQFEHPFLTNIQIMLLSCIFTQDFLSLRLPQLCEAEIILSWRQWSVHVRLFWHHFYRQGRTCSLPASYINKQGAQTLSPAWSSVRAREQIKVIV